MWAFILVKNDVISYVSSAVCSSVGQLTVGRSADCQTTETSSESRTTEPPGAPEPSEPRITQPEIPAGGAQNPGLVPLPGRRPDLRPEPTRLFLLH